MQIFVTDPDPYNCAHYLDDKRVVKMVLESAQMLSTVIAMYDPSFHQRYEYILYQPSHANHPCTLWVSESMRNFNWLFEHYNALCTEYTARYHKIHKSQSLRPVFSEFMLKVSGGKSAYIKAEPPRNFVNCSLYKDEPDVFKAYQLTLADKWEADKRIPQWYGSGR